MRCTVYRILSVLIFIMLAFGTILGQDMRNNGIMRQRSAKPEKQVKIENELKRLKKEDNSANLSRIIELNKQLEALTGNSKTEYGSLINSNAYGSNWNMKSAPLAGGFADDIQNTVIYSNPNRKIKCLAAAIEQRGPTAGRIWTVVFYSADTLSPDTLRVYYSANGGVSWNLYVQGNIRPGDFVTPDDMDMELVENTSGQKYLWVAFGFKKPWGRRAVGAFTLQIPALNGTFYNLLQWPGSDTTGNYYNVRLTSDNARYLSTPYVYLICSFDSLGSSGNRVNTQKYARILSPYSLNNPAISFMNSKYYWYESSSAFVRTSYSDIAYFYNGDEDSVQVSFCGVPDSTRIYFAKSDISGIAPLGSAGAGGNIGGMEPNSYKTHARLSTNGNNNGNVVCAFRQFTAGNWNVKWFSSSSYGNFEAPFTESDLLGSSINPNFPPEIVGVRSGGTHYVSFLTGAAEDSIHYISMNQSGILYHVNKMNYFSAAEEISPKPVFRYQTGDSCILIYSEEGPKNMVSSAGCAGSPIGILNYQIPSKFSLMQNYPNPFNPSTKIAFSIPNRAHLKLAVYDVQGKVIALLADSEYYAGNYEITFDAVKYSSGVYFYRLEAGGYTEIKKMVFLK
jgi:Secretion system C-terminal sorting domain